MPFVNIKITREGATPEKKQELIAGVTRLLADVLGKNPKTTVVVIEVAIACSGKIARLKSNMYRKRSAGLIYSPRRGSSVRSSPAAAYWNLRKMSFIDGPDPISLAAVN